MDCGWRWCCHACWCIREWRWCLLKIEQVQGAQGWIRGWCRCVADLWWSRWREASRRSDLARSYFLQGLTVVVRDMADGIFPARLRCRCVNMWVRRWFRSPCELLLFSRGRCCRATMLAVVGGTRGSCRRGWKADGGWVLLWWPWLLGFPGEETRVVDNDMAVSNWCICVCKD